MEKDFERELAKKLNERTIAPSAGAWERVNLQRARSRKKKPTPLYWIAAALILGAGLLFSDFGNQAPVQNPQVVNPTTTVAPGKANDFAPTVVNVSQPAAIARPLANRQKERIADSRPMHEALAAVEPNVAELRRHESAPMQVEIGVRIEKMAVSGQQPGQDDLDALIANARRDLASGKGLMPRTDASALLQDSESELDKTYRSGIIESLFKQKRIKVALSSH